MTELDAGIPQESAFERALHGRSKIVFLGGLLLLLAHAFVPLQEFVHRGDDAYYYFKVAVNYARLGYWTFDGIHPSNGVQPLWGFVLSASAVVFHWIGITDLDLLARLFVAQTGLLHFAGCVVLYHLLRRYVSVGAGVAAAGAFLFPMGIVWTRVWGMENSLYGLLLASSVLYYHRVVRAKGTARSAACLGVLLGLTTLCRLNSGFFIVCLFAFYLLGPGRTPLGQRLRVCFVAGAVASLLIIPVLAYFLQQTGHMLPVAGGAKAIRAKLFLESRGVDSVFSLKFLRVMYDWAWPAMKWWVTSRALDGTWIGGGRLLHTGRATYSTLACVTAFLFLAPMVTLRPAAWLRTLGGQLRRLAPFSYVLVFALLNAAISLTFFPYEATYSIVRWWLLEGEIVVTVLFALLTVSSLGFLASHYLPQRLHLPLASLGLAALTVLHLGQSYRFYWDGETQYPDWSVSTNEERYAAAMWIRDNLPEDAIIGCWNAGVIGYYSGRHIVNLDGLINSWDFLPYLESGDLPAYFEKEGLQYLADTNYEIRWRAGKKFRGTLNAESVYRKYMDPEETGLKYKDQYFHVYKLREAAGNASGAASGPGD